MAVVLYKDDLIPIGAFKKETLDSLLAEGFAREQIIDGVKFIKMTTPYFEELGDYIKLHPAELCRDYWKDIVLKTKNCDIMVFIKKFCETHAFINKITDGEVDFTEVILEELNG